MEDKLAVEPEQGSHPGARAHATTHAGRPMGRRKRIAIALLYGAATHLAFAVAVLAMIQGLNGGLQAGRGTLHGATAWYANSLLIVQFPLLHSFLLSRGGRRLLALLAPRELGRDLAPTTFALIASLQLVATFVAWSPSGIVLAAPTGLKLWVMRAAFVASWIFLLRALSDAGLGLQTGAIGWLAAWRGERPRFGPFPTHGLFSRCRQPIYLGFALTLWTGPVRTLDGLLLALTWTTYCVAGPLHKELRWLEWFGESFARYRAQVPYFLPRIKP